MCMVVALGYNDSTPWHVERMLDHDNAVSSSVSRFQCCSRWDIRLQLASNDTPAWNLQGFACNNLNRPARTQLVILALQYHKSWVAWFEYCAAWKYGAVYTDRGLMFFLILLLIHHYFQSYWNLVNLNVIHELRSLSIRQMYDGKISWMDIWSAWSLAYGMLACCWKVYFGHSIRSLELGHLHLCDTTRTVVLIHHKRSRYRSQG